MIILGLLGFTLTARIKAQPGAPTFHVGRFVLWLVFAVLALALFRMIPFFILIAAPADGDDARGVSRRLAAGGDRRADRREAAKHPA